MLRGKQSGARVLQVSILRTLFTRGQNLAEAGHLCYHRQNPTTINPACWTDFSYILPL